MQTIEAKRIRPSRDQLRSEMSEMNELVSSINENGLLEPIVVRHVPDGYEVVAGNRRYEACRRLNIGRIPCHIVELDDREAFETSLIENVQRETLSLIDEARAFKRYSDDFGYGAVSELARKIGKSHSYVSRRIRLLSLPQSLRDELVRRRTSASIAQELLSLKDEGEVESITNLIIHEKQNMTHREVRMMVKKLKDAGPCVRPREKAEFEGPSYCTSQVRREQTLGRIFARSITALRLCMSRLDNIYEQVDEGEWLVREVLMRQRKLIHDQLDELLIFKSRMSRDPPSLAKGGTENLRPAPLSGALLFRTRAPTN